MLKLQKLIIFMLFIFGVNKPLYSTPYTNEPIDTLKQIESLRKTASRYSAIKDYETSNNYLSNAYNLAIQIKDSSEITSILRAQGKNAEMQNNNKLALEYCRLESKFQSYTIYTRFIKIFFSLNLPDSARYYFTKEHNRINKLAISKNSYSHTSFYAKYYITKDIKDSALFYNDSLIRMCGSIIKRAPNFNGALEQVSDYAKYLVAKSYNHKAIEVLELGNLMKNSARNNSSNKIYNTSFRFLNLKLNNLKLLDSLSREDNMIIKRGKILEEVNDIIIQLKKNEKEAQLAIIEEKHNLAKQTINHSIKLVNKQNNNNLLLIWGIIIISILALVIVYNKNFNDSHNKDAALENKESKTDSFNHDLFNNIQSYLTSKKLFLNTELNRKEIAIKLRTNEVYVKNAIKACTNMTVNDYINSLRVKYACELMKTENNLKIDIIGKSSGFSSGSTFLRAFIKQIGMTPREYRNTIA